MSHPSRSRFSTVVAMVATVFTIGCPLRGPGQEPPLRPWKDTQGRVIQALFIKASAESVTLRTTDGKEHDIPFSRLSAEDQAYAKSQAALKPALAPAPAAAATQAPDPARVPVEKRVWPQNVAVPGRAIEIQAVEESAATRRFVYRSEAFEFTSQAKLAGSVMKEVARTFEATRALVTALPWGVVCRPPEGLERYQAALYETREDYIAAGGPENSGGVYMSGDKIFKVPFPSIGLEMRGKTFFKNDNYSGDTLIHEITHQMMHDYLPFLPVWVIEGTAEYTEMLPYNAGTFRADAHKGAMKDHVSEMQKRGLAPTIPSLEAHMTMRRAEWSGIADRSNEAMGELYLRSALVVYYFCHLDGDKKGTRFLKFMDAVHGETEALRLFFQDPRVKRHPDGSFSYPKSFPPPDMKAESAPFKHLPLLLDGRSYSQIAQEMTEAYKAMGVKVSVN